jgi:hypothetical protein
MRMARFQNMRQWSGAAFETLSVGRSIGINRNGPATSDGNVAGS